MFTIPPLSSDILAISFDAKSSPSININLPNINGESNAFGWGFGWYPDDNLSTLITKDPAASGKQILVDTITDWASFRSTVFFCKVRGAENGYSHTDTQPFSRSFAGCDWLFMHNGDLDMVELKKHPRSNEHLLEPLGKTDSELAFCDLLEQLNQINARRISDVDPTLLHSWFKRFDALGSSDMYLSDGESIVCFQGSQSPKNLYHGRIQPPDNQQLLTSQAAHVKFNDPRDSYRTALIVTSSPFTTGNWTQMKPGEMIIIRRGAVIWDSAPDNQLVIDIPNPAPIPPQSQPQNSFMGQTLSEQAQLQSDKPNAHVLNVRAQTRTPEGLPLNFRMFEVTHTTQYEYSEPVEHSTHVFRLQPTDDLIQQVDYSKLEISSPTEDIQYEDVFGNHAIHCVINKPYQSLTVQATSKIKIFASPPDDHSPSRRQTTIPLVWMPWQRQMMMPYLLPEELPETQLTELTEYAMSFVERNDYHLLNTIKDMNLSIYRDYKYVTGSTSLNTTPFTVYTSREGVCQDFANLFICMTRLLGIPARYRMGYIYTGVDYSNKIQSEASHAWAEVYLPYIGWRGYDPTNGCNVAQDHIRVAAGRNYRDATPTSGTIYRGGGTETLKVDVKLRELNE